MVLAPFSFWQTTRWTLIEIDLFWGVGKARGGERGNNNKLVTDYIELFSNLC